MQGENTGSRNENRRGHPAVEAGTARGASTEIPIPCERSEFSSPAFGHLPSEPRSRRRESAHLVAFKARVWRRLTSAATVQGQFVTHLSRKEVNALF